jgi:hypothetical protein
MNKILLLLNILCSVIYADAQNNSWKIKLNTKTILSTSKEDENANTKKIKSTDWKKNGKLEIIFTEAEPGVWWRSFLFFDENDNQLLAKDSTTHAIVSMAYLRKLFAGKKEIHIYTSIAPVDPSIAIRARRVHLCTLKLP